MIWKKFKTINLHTVKTTFSDVSLYSYGNINYKVRKEKDKLDFYSF